MSTPKKPQSLADFAKQFEKVSCFACVIPERDEIDAAYKSGITRKVILKWLWEAKGYNDKSVMDDNGHPAGISATMVDKHFTGGHHHKKGDAI